MDKEGEVEEDSDVEDKNDLEPINEGNNDSKVADVAPQRIQLRKSTTLQIQTTPLWGLVHQLRKM